MSEWIFNPETTRALDNWEQERRVYDELRESFGKQAERLRAAEQALGKLVAPEGMIETYLVPVGHHFVEIRRYVGSTNYSVQYRTNPTTKEK